MLVGMPRPPLPRTLRELRQQRGLTQEAVAILAGVDLSTVSLLERGLRSASPAMVVKLAKGMGIAAGRMRAILEAVDERSTPEERPA